MTVNETAFDRALPTWTVTGPVEAPCGTITTTALSVQFTTDAAMPLKLTVAVVFPRLRPRTLTWVPAAPEDGEQ